MIADILICGSLITPDQTGRGYRKNCFRLYTKLLLRIASKTQTGGWKLSIYKSIEVVSKE
jgi:hypothetical protein